MSHVQGGVCLKKLESNAQLRVSLRLCGVFPPYEYYCRREVLVKAYIKAQMVLSNVAQCTHSSDWKHGWTQRLAAALSYLMGPATNSTQTACGGVLWGGVEREPPQGCRGER